MADARHPWGGITKFRFKVSESKLDENSPIRTWISIDMTPEAGSPLLMVGFWFPDTNDTKEAAEFYKRAKEIETLLDGSIKAVSFQTLN